MRWCEEGLSTMGQCISVISLRIAGLEAMGWNLWVKRSADRLPTVTASDAPSGVDDGQSANRCSEIQY